jgi:DNA mismatch repair ATPase MutS
MDTVEALTPYLQQGFISAWQREERYTQVGLALWHLVTRQTEQYSLFHDVRDQEKSGALQQTMDRVHTKFGRNALTRASALQVKSGTNMGFSSPLYGD